MAKPFGWQHRLAAILAAAVMLAAGVCGSLAAIGPRYCGEITVEAQDEDTLNIFA